MVTGFQNPLHLGLRERQGRLVRDLRGLHRARRVLRDPVVVHAEPEERPQPFEVLGRVVGAVGPSRAELSHLLDTELLQVPVPLGFTPRQEALVQQVLVLPESLTAELLRLGVGQEALKSLADGRDVGLLDHADFASGFPVADQVGGGRPRPQVERAADVLAAEGPLDPDRDSCSSGSAARRTGKAAGAGGRGSACSLRGRKRPTRYKTSTAAET